MRVLLLAPPLARTGGIQRYSLCLMRALRYLLGDQSVRCLAIPDSGDRSAHSRFSAGLKVRFGWQAIWESTRWKPDLIICTHLALGPIGRLIAALHRRQYWVVVHGIEAWSPLPYWKRAALRRADRLITTSAFSREQVVKRHHIDDRRMLCLPCTLDDTLLRVEPAKADACTGIAEGQRLVLTVARMAASERYKGHDVMLQALPFVIAKIPNLTYAIVGDGDDRPRLESLANDLGLANHVLFAGEVSDSQLAGLYHRSEVFALPARTMIDDRNPKGEGFGIVFLEAMAFGNPVIGPNYGAPADLIRHGETGLTVDPEDPAAVAKALLYLLTSPDEAKRMGASASRWVRQEYSFDLFCRRLGDLLFELDYIDRVQQNRAAALESTWVDHGGSAGGNP